MAPLEIVPILPYSDGDPGHVPKPDWSLSPSASVYLDKLAPEWMKRRGEHVAGKTFRVRHVLVFQEPLQVSLLAGRIQVSTRFD